MSFKNYKKKYDNDSKNFEPKKELPEIQESKFEESAEAKIFEINQIRKNYSKVAFLSNFRTVQIKDENNLDITSLLLVFYSQSGEWLNCYLKYDPYFLLKCAEDKEGDLAAFLEKKYEGKFKNIAIEEKVDLQTMNHLSGIKTKFLKCSFSREMDFILVKSDIQKKLALRKSHHFTRRFDTTHSKENMFELIENIYEHDINYSARVCIHS